MKTPHFKAGDWVRRKSTGVIYQVRSVDQAFIRHIRLVGSDWTHMAEDFELVRPPLRPAVYLLSYTYLDGWADDVEVTRYEVWLGDYQINILTDPEVAAGCACFVAKLNGLQLIRGRRK